MLVLQKGLILPVPMYGGSYFFIQPFHILTFFYFPTASPSADNLYTPVHNHIPNHTW